MVKTILFCRDINHRETTVSVKRSSGSWTHDVKLVGPHLRLLRNWLQNNEETWEYMGAGLDETFLQVHYAQRQEAHDG